ncbi:MAG: hypothetical protein HQK75_03845 [Candidatus Magnetomorum sp.]|nr:hypothetical protein [Candidatus Magnetomorum sp.]
MYLDADLFFYASPDPIWQELDQHSVMIHEHRFSPEQKYLERNGKYNVGLLCFKNDSQGMKVLNWWRSCCNEWCFYRLEEGKFGDQLYLNQFPTRFQGVKILEHIGAGVAPWNHIQYQFSIDEHGKKWVDNYPLIFYHFHSLEMLLPEVVIPSKYFPITPLTKDIICACFEPYVDKLYKNYKRIQTIYPDFSGGLVKNRMLNRTLLFIAHQSIQANIKHFNLPYTIIPLTQDWLLYSTPDLRSNTRHKKNQSYLSNPSPPEKLLDQAKNEQRKGNIVIAIQLLLKIVNQYPNHPLALNDLAIIHWNVGDKNQAIHYLKMAHHHAPFEKKIINNLGGMLIHLGRKDEAACLLNKYLSQSPDDIEIQNLMNIC